MRPAAALVVAGWLGACVGPLPAPSAGAPPRIAIIAAERGPLGARLVSIDERGDRQLELIEPPTARVRDTHPAVSPDGAWLVFASTRGRPIDETSLWIARIGQAAAPRPLTRSADGEAPRWAVLDAHPVWRPDGSAVVFASTRAAGNFDLWELELRAGQPGALRQLTSAPGHEVTPSVAPDGAIYYAAVTPDAARREVQTRLEVRLPDGEIRPVTDGPADSSPAVSPDGSRVAFSRPALHGGAPDSELWSVARAGGTPTQVIDLPLTEESGAVWSRDGRFLFATSALRGADGRVVFSSIIHVDTRDRAPVARMLEDRVGPIVRLTPAVTATPLDARALHENPEYLPELARIMSRAIEQQRSAPP